MAGTHSWVRLTAVLVLCGGGYLGTAPAQTPDPKQAPLPWELPAALHKAAPENVDDLRAIEKHVQKVLAKVMPAVVGLRVGPGQGSGVLVGEDGTILTAGHVSGTPNQNAAVILPDGKTLKGKSLGRYTTIDSGMMKIVEEGKYPSLEMGNSSELKVGQWVIAIGHPGGFRANRTPVVRVGRILYVSAFVIRTDCTLVGGDSGGPLFDMHGRVIGIHSRIGDKQITENMHVPIDTFRKTWERLAKGESWGGPLGRVEVVRSAGGKVVFEKQDRLAKDDPKDKFQKDSHCKIYTVRFQAGSTYTLDLISGDKTGTKLDTFLRLESPHGKDLAQDDDGGGFPNSRIVWKALQDGDYRLVATSYEADQTGPFTLKVFEADAKDALVAGKVEVLKAINLHEAVVAPLLQKFKKTPLHLNTVLIDEQGNPLPGKEITFHWEAGKETLKSNGDGVVRWTLVNGKSKKLSLDIPQGSRAVLGLTDAEGLPIGLTLDEKVKSAGGPVIDTIDGKLTVQDTYDKERKRCYRQVFPLALQADKTYTIDLVSADFDAYLRLEHDKKGKVAEDNDSAGNLNARIVYTPTAEGDYRIVVTTYDAGQVGTFRVTVQETKKVVMP
jgi:S1-C subfamily serine protease